MSTVWAPNAPSTKAVPAAVRTASVTLCSSSDVVPGRPRRASAGTAMGPVTATSGIRPRNTQRHPKRCATTAATPGPTTPGTTQAVERTAIIARPLRLVQAATDGDVGDGRHCPCTEPLQDTPDDEHPHRRCQPGHQEAGREQHEPRHEGPCRPVPVRVTAGHDDADEAGQLEAREDPSVKRQAMQVTSHDRHHRDHRQRFGRDEGDAEHQSGREGPLLRSPQPVSRCAPVHEGETTARSRWYSAAGRAHGAADHRRRPTSLRIEDDLVRVHRPRAPCRRALHHRRRGGVALVDVAGQPPHPAGGADPRAFHPDRRRPAPAPARRARAGVVRRTRARRLPPPRCTSGVTRRLRARCGRHVPQLRPPVGAAVGVGPGGTAGQRAGLQPLCRRRLRRGRRAALRRGPRAAARPRMGGGGDPAGARRRRAAGHDRPGAGGRQAPLAPGFRPGVGRLQSRGSRPGVPRLRVREPPPSSLARGRAGRRRAALRLHLLVPGTGGRPGEPDPPRGARAFPGPAHRRRRADRELGAELPVAHRRRIGLLHPTPR